jgi:type II secretory pathway component PulM
MNQILERLRNAWEELNDREKRLVGTLGVIAACFILGFPLFWTAHQNSEIEEENAQLRSALTLIDSKRAQLQALAEARRNSAQRYLHHTPPLGSFLESKAGDHSLKIGEVTDQPEKSSGNYNRRSVRASINDVGLTGIVDLLGDIETSEYPVAVDHLQIEHYTPGDTFRAKVGVLTFDQTEHKSSTNKPAAGKSDEPESGG